jgi:Flp pilus assembly pilin Flp
VGLRLSRAHRNPSEETEDEMLNTHAHNRSSNEDGQTLTEYALIISVVSLGVLVGFGLLGTAIGGRYDSILSAVTGFLT